MPDFIARDGKGIEGRAAAIRARFNRVRDRIDRERGAALDESLTSRTLHDREPRTRHLTAPDGRTYPSRAASIHARFEWLMGDKVGPCPQALPRGLEDQQPRD